MSEIKKPQETIATMTEMVLPNDTNTLNNLMGGRLMHWMDIVGGVSAQRHSNKVVVTASVDNISFSKPIKLGNIVTLKAIVTRSFNTSMEVFIEVFAEDIPNKTHFKSHEAFLTFVAVNEKGSPVRVPELIPEQEIEQKQFKEALQRRQMRLILAGKMDPEEAPDVQSLFIKKQ